MSAAADSLRVQGPDSGGNPVPVTSVVGTLTGATLDSGTTYSQSAPAANTQAQVTITNVTGKTIYFYGFDLCNIGSAASATSQITVADGATTLYQFLSGVVANGSHIAGANNVPANGGRGVRITAGNNLVVTVATGGVNSQWLLTVYFNQF